jgi:hypothetical protein
MPLKKKPKKKAIKKAVKKTPKKRTVKRKAAKKTAVRKGPVKVKEQVVGTVTHYFPHVQAAVIKLKTPLSVGDSIKIKGHTTDFTQKISSMQIDRVPIESAKKGNEIGLLVESRVRQHDVVYKA